MCSLYNRACLIEFFGSHSHFEIDFELLQDSLYDSFRLHSLVEFEMQTRKDLLIFELQTSISIMPPLCPCL